MQIAPVNWFVWVDHKNGIKCVHWEFQCYVLNITNLLFSIFTDIFISSVLLLLILFALLNVFSTVELCMLYAADLQLRPLHVLQRVADLVHIPIQVMNMNVTKVKKIETVCKCSFCCCYFFVEFCCHIATMFGKI